MNSISSSYSTSYTFTVQPTLILSTIYLILYDDFYVLKDLLNLLDTGLDVALLILRCIVLCVLGKVALLARLFDLASNFFSLFTFKSCSSSSKLFQSRIS